MPYAILTGKTAKASDGSAFELVLTPDGRTMTAFDADLLGFEIASFAAINEALSLPARAGIALEAKPGSYVTASGDTLTEIEASKRGFITVTHRELAAAEQVAGITRAPAPVPAPTPPPEVAPHVKAILSLPEASTRPRAAVALAMGEHGKDMETAKAARLLRSLPEETPEAFAINTGQPTARALAPLSGKAAYTVRRKIEIAAAGAAHRAAAGNTTAQREATNLGYACKLMTQGSTIERACDIAGVNLSTYL